MSNDDGESRGERQMALSALDEGVIYAALKKQGRDESVHLQVSETVASTNDQVMANLPAVSERFSVCVANQQTAGRGRNGAQWVSPANANIYISVGAALESVVLNEMGGLSLACGVVLARLFKGMGIGVGVKWPNDLLFEQKKLAGILIETRIKANQVYVVVGLGLNVQMPAEASKNIGQPWVDLMSIVENQRIKLDRNDLVAKLINEISACLLEYEVSAFDSFRADWGKFDMLSGKNVTVKTDDGAFEGEVIGVAEDCALIVCVEGEEKKFHAADIKLKIK